MKKLDKITLMEDNFSKWYIDVITKGELIDYGLVKGTMIFKPNSFAIWENIQKILNNKFTTLGVKNVYMPMFIPKKMFELEKKHIEGFAPELATITKIGEKKLDEEIVVRPTSELLFCQYFKENIDSYNDLPLLLNQWANVIRMEKTVNPFLRNSEFLWQEGHTIHQTKEEAQEFTVNIINLYAEFCQEYLAIPTLIGMKTKSERFAGADTTYTIEAMMKDGKALQSGTSHYLAQNFSKPFKIEYKDRDNKRNNVYQTSWGVSTRLIGALIMTHGDNRGIVIPPKVAPVQIDVIEIFANKNDNVSTTSKQICDLLSPRYRVNIDKSDKGPGYKAAESEIKGTPIRIEVGPRDLENQQVTIVRRDTLEKQVVMISDIEKTINNLILDIQNNLLINAQEKLKNNIVEVQNYDDFKVSINDNKFVKVYYYEDENNEKTIKEDTTATPRCYPLNMQTEKEGKCFYSGKITNKIAIFAKAY